MVKGLAELTGSEDEMNFFKKMLVMINGGVIAFALLIL